MLWCGFYGCKYDIQGYKEHADDLDEIIGKKVEIGDAFMYFKAKTIKWDCIKIAVRKLSEEKNVSDEMRLLIEMALRRGDSVAAIARMFNLGHHGEDIVQGIQDKMEG